MLRQLRISELIIELASDCDIDRLTASYVLRRFKAEGHKFLTVTLPKLAKAVLASIEAGYFIRPTDFAWKGRSLRYFRSLLDKIFCCKTGILLQNPCAVALRCFRQFTEYMFKLALDFDSELLVQKEKNYEQIQIDIGQSDYDQAFHEEMRRYAETNYAYLFKLHPEDIFEKGVVRSGPGAVASGAFDGSFPHYVWKKLPDSVIGTCDTMHRAYSGYFKPYPASPTKVKLVHDSRVAEVLFVPKDSRGPRVISKEPAHLIRAQMAFLTCITSLLELRSGHRNNFANQGINQSLAKSSSVSRHLATLDLKDASDRVRYRSIRHIFRYAPGITWFLRHARSTHAKLPSGRLIKLNSLAGMGSGFTFTLLGFFIKLAVETHVCTTLKLPYKEVSQQIYVYGDDLVIPSRWFDLSQEALRRAGLMVNTEKSFVKGPFRESCGADYMSGVECVPTRLRLASAKPYIENGFLAFNNSDGAILQICKHAQELRMNGWLNTAAFWENYLSRYIPMPVVEYGSSVLGRLATDSDIYRDNELCNKDGRVQFRKKVCIAVPEKVQAEGLCPYKHISGLLRSERVGVSIMLPYSVFPQWPKDEPFVKVYEDGLPYGVVPIPRRIRIKYRGNVSIEAARAAS